MTGMMVFLLIVVLYFSARVTRLEVRMNAIEAHFNRHVKEGLMEESHTDSDSKVFKDHGPIKDNLQMVARDARDVFDRLRR